MDNLPRQGNEIGHEALLGAGAGADEDEIFADRFQPLIQLLPRPAPRRHHGDDRADADDNAQAGQD